MNELDGSVSITVRFILKKVSTGWLQKKNCGFYWLRKVKR